MGITATLPVFLLSNSIALKGMLEENRLYHLLDDTRCLEDWHEWVSTASHQRDSTRPGHVFEMRWKKFCQEGGVGLIHALDCLSEEYLEVHNSRLYIKEQELFSRWQNLRSRMGLLPVKCRMRYKHELTMQDKLVHPLSPRLDHYIGEAGLNEMHLHFFSCQRPDTSWLVDIQNVHGFEYFEARGGKSLRRLYLSVHADLTPQILAKRLKLAHVIRTCLLEMQGAGDAGLHVHRMRDAYISLVNNPKYYPSNQEKVRTYREVHILEQEEMQLWKFVFSRVEGKKDYWREVQFFAHLYLLIQNEYMHLHRHNEKSRGFAAFQDVTHHKTQGFDVEKYCRRAFAQLCQCSCAASGACIEVRITPDFFLRHAKMLVKCWQEVRESFQRGRVVFVLHFTKGVKKEKSRSLPIMRDRYMTKRAEMKKLCKKVVQYVKTCHKELRIPLGLDAAGNELELPVEVMAPVFRQFERGTGISYRTYHCGEDFLHLVSGIRAVYDAVNFLKLNHGNRVGHATAVGILPEQWVRDMPEVVYLRAGDYLLDLLFAWRMLGEGYADERIKVERLLMPIAYRIFGKGQVWDVHALQLFYDVRYFEPGLAARYASPGAVLSEDMKEMELVEEHKAQYGEVGLELLKTWNYDLKSQEEQDELVAVPVRFLSPNILLYLQQKVQRFINERNVVIESLPVSNLRISQYSDIRQHHILRWLGVPGHAQEGDEVMNVCLGSDDPGIMVTDIKNEYYHVYANLMQEGIPPADCIKYVQRLNETGKVYAFRALHPDDEALEEEEALNKTHFFTCR